MKKKIINRNKNPASGTSSWQHDENEESDYVAVHCEAEDRVIPPGANAGSVCRKKSPAFAPDLFNSNAPPVASARAIPAKTYVGWPSGFCGLE
jgi:hypothetical protein